MSATPTLELGINIGDIDAIVSELVPFNNFKQRMGRAGRSNQKISYAFMILNDKDPMSQYYQKHPQDYKTDNLEILLDPENPYVKKIHLLFMACDKALSSKEMNFVDNDLISSGVLNYTGEGFSPNPSLKKYFDNYSIRDIGQQVEIETNHKKIGEWDKPMAYQKLFPGSVYLHNGNVFRSVFFNDDFKPKVIVKDITKEYPYIRTQPRIEKFPIVEKNLKTEKLFDFSISLCHIYINYVIREFKEWNTVTNETKIKHLVTDFKFSLNTMGIEIDLNPLSKKILDSPTISQNKSSAFHTLEHVLIHSSNMIAGGVAGDIDGISIPSENKICIFDRSTNGGNGACKALFLILEKAINRSLDILNSCLCGRSDGCPRCTYLYGCDKFNSDLNKDGAKTLLRIMLNSQNSLN